MTWYEAAWYCNWLSGKEGIPEDQWCYEPLKKEDSVAYGPGMKAKDTIWELRGYRLPTEAEWEFACRSGTVTSRYYGLSETLLPRYAWYLANGENRTWPVMDLKPNDSGLFGMLGNAYEWCFDEPVRYPQRTNDAVEDLPTTKPVEATGRRVLRGGAFDRRPMAVRSAYRVNTSRSTVPTAWFSSCQNLPLILFTPLPLFVSIPAAGGSKLKTQHCHFGSPFREL